MIHARMIVLTALGCIVTPAEDPVTITFDKVETGKPMPTRSADDRDDS